jgi:DNA-binding response OmpR family regulator
MSDPEHDGSVSFGVFELDLRGRELRKQGIEIKLQAQPFQVLAMLVATPQFRPSVNPERALRSAPNLYC